MLEWPTFIMASAATLVGLIRIYQNERLYKWHRKVHKKRKKK